MGIMTGGAVADSIMYRIIRSMAYIAFRDARLSVLLVTINTGNVCFMAGSLGINQSLFRSMAVFADRFSRGVCKFDMGRHVRIMTYKALLI